MTSRSSYSNINNLLNSIFLPKGRFKYVKMAGVGGVIALSWYSAYTYLVNRIDKDCLLVRQTLFNLKRDDRINGILGENYSVEPGSIRGEMNMIRGHADITFKIKDSDALVHVVSKRKRGAGSWITETLELNDGSSTITVIPRAV